MEVWHLTADAPRRPRRVSASDQIELHIGTWPVEPGQAVTIECKLERPDGVVEDRRVDGAWQRNEGANSYWRAVLGPFLAGSRLTYTIRARSQTGEQQSPSYSLRIGPKLYLAILWHQHQPLYKDVSRRDQRGSYLQPWVRLHAIRDYYPMASLVAEHPRIRLTINLVPSLLAQLQDYLERGATDRALELTLKAAETLARPEREAILGGFFDAQWHNQIYPHPRYKELLTKAWEGSRFTAQDLRDLQMWFNLAWFGKEFRDGEVTLATGEQASVRQWVEKGRDFTIEDIKAMVEVQYRIMRAIVPLHRRLQDEGRIEVSTTPFYHPILPLLVDTDEATIDRAGAVHPHRFAHPEDARAQVEAACRYHRNLFGRTPHGMWPAEGAVSESVLPFFAGAGVRWIATDEKVLARSGRWGYETARPDVRCQPYRVDSGGESLAIFFRDTDLSDGIGFRYHAWPDAQAAARDFIDRLKEELIARFNDDADRIVTVILDGENAWGSYADDGRPFLTALYRLLSSDQDIETVTFREYLDGNKGRNISPHPIAQLPVVHDLFAGSWIDEAGSEPGVDLGTWIGEPEENAAWELLGEARDTLSQHEASANREAFEAIYAAEGSDWFWWFGADQDSGGDAEFERLFKLHLANVYGALGKKAPASLRRHMVPREVIWTFTRPVRSINTGDRLTVRTNCPGVLSWSLDAGLMQSAELKPAGGVMAGAQRFQLQLGLVPEGVSEVNFSFRCLHPGCEGQDLCCREDRHTVRVRRRGRSQ